MNFWAGPAHPGGETRPPPPLLQSSRHQNAELSRRGVRRLSLKRLGFWGIRGRRSVVAPETPRRKALEVGIKVCLSRTFATIALNAEWILRQTPWVAVRTTEAS